MGLQPREGGAPKAAVGQIIDDELLVRDVEVVEVRNQLLTSADFDLIGRAGDVGFAGGGKRNGACQDKGGEKASKEGGSELHNEGFFDEGLWGNEWPLGELRLKRAKLSA